MRYHGLGMIAAPESIQSRKQALIVEDSYLLGLQMKTDLEDLGRGSGSSADFDLDSEFTITHFPIGLGYESDDVG